MCVSRQEGGIGEGGHLGGGAEGWEHADLPRIPIDGRNKTFFKRCDHKGLGKLRPSRAAGRSWSVLGGPPLKGSIFILME